MPPHDAAALIDRAIHAWRARDTPANTGLRGRAEARRLCEDFLGRFGPAPFPLLREPVIFQWLADLYREPRWCTRSRRPNRAMPPRIIKALLRCAGYAGADNISGYQRRYHGTTAAVVELVAWQRELAGGIDGRIFDDVRDNQLLWNAYVVAWKAAGGAHKARADRHRSWTKHTGCVVDDRAAPHTPPGVPPGFDDPRNARIDPYVRFFVGVRWGGTTEAMDLFRTLTAYCDHIDNEAHASTMRAYIRPFYRICVSLAPAAASLVECLDRTTRESCIAALQTIRLDKGRCVKCLYQFTAGGPWAPLLRWAPWRPISRREANYRPPKRQRLRDRFTDAEILRMQQCALSDPFAHGLLTFLLHTGCCTGAVCHLLVRDVQDADAKHRMRTLGSVREKGGVVRYFCIDPILMDALRGAIRCNRGSDHVFPANGGVHRRHKAQNALWLRQLCDRAGVVGSHVHMHAIRRTVISRLLDCGNTLSAVSSWIGHSSPTMTYTMAPVCVCGEQK